MIVEFSAQLLWLEFSTIPGFIFHHHHGWLQQRSVFRIWRAESRFRPKLMRIVVSHLGLVSFLFLHYRGQEMTHKAMTLITVIKTVWQIQYRIITLFSVILTKGLWLFAKQSSKSSLNKLSFNSARAKVNSLGIKLLENN